jgi:hypothetical protein
MIKVRSSEFYISKDGWGLNEAKTFCKELSFKRGVGFAMPVNDRQKYGGLNITYSCGAGVMKLSDCSLHVQKGEIMHTANAFCYDSLGESLLPFTLHYST